MRHPGSHDDDYGMARVIEKIVPEDEGFYTCQGRNDLGVMEVSIQVDVQGLYNKWNPCKIPWRTETGMSVWMPLFGLY